MTLPRLRGLSLVRSFDPVPCSHVDLSGLEILQLTGVGVSA